MVSYHIDPEKCQACLICGRHCPVDGISGGKGQIHVIDQSSCIKCGSCFDACPTRFDAVRKIVGEPVPPPLPEEDRTLVRKKKKKKKKKAREQPAEIQRNKKTDLFSTHSHGYTTL